MADLRTLERQLNALSNRNRLRILQELKKKRHMSVSQVAKFLRISLPAASRHLRELADVGIIKGTKRGVFVIYRLALGGERWVKQVLATIA